MDKCPRDRLEAAAKLLEDGLASTIAKRALGGVENTLS